MSCRHIAHHLMSGGDGTQHKAPALHRCCCWLPPGCDLSQEQRKYQGPTFIPIMSTAFILQVLINIFLVIVHVHESIYQRVWTPSPERSWHDVSFFSLWRQISCYILRLNGGAAVLYIAVIQSVQHSYDSWNAVDWKVKYCVLWWNLKPTVSFITILCNSTNTIRVIILNILHYGLKPPTSICRTKYTKV